MKAYLFIATALMATVQCCIISPVQAANSATTLEQALATVYQNNPQLAAARAQLRATDEQVSQAMSGWRPTVNATATNGVSQQDISGNGYSGSDHSLNPRTIGVNLTQPVFSGFRTVAGVKSAEASVRAQQASLQDTEQRVFLETAKAYLDVVEAQTVLELNRENETVLQNKLTEVKDRLRIKELSKTDVSQSQSRLNAATVSRLNAEGNLANKRQTYARLVGQLPPVLQQPVVNYALPKTLDAAVGLAESKNPAVIAAQFSHTAAKADIKTAKGNLLPSVDIVGNAGRQIEQSAFGPGRQNDTTVQVKFTMPLYTGGTDYSKTRQAQETAQQKDFEYNDARNRAKEQAATAWQSYATAKEASLGNKQVVEAETGAYEGVTIEAKYGTRTTLDVLNAQQELVNAKINLARADHDQTLALLQLKAAIGELTAENLNLGVKRYDPDQNLNNVRNKLAGFSRTEQ